MNTACIYLVTYAGLLACAGIVAYNVYHYLQNPMHVRWELYPVAHERGDRAEYGGSYLEDADWWKTKRKTSLVGGIKGVLVEFLFMHMTMTTNMSLWHRTYPFHLGLYCIIGAFGLTFLAALARLAGTEPGIILIALGNIVQVLTFAGFLSIVGGGISLLHRRLSQESLRRYSTREHFFNLGAFIVFGVTGLLAWLANPSFFAISRDFMANLICFSFKPLSSNTFIVFVLLGSILIAYIPATHMGHFFMKYFLYHDIRWGDQPAQDDPAAAQKIGAVLGYQVSWKAPHINGDGKKTWADVATSNPTAPKE